MYYQFPPGGARAFVDANSEQISNKIQSTGQFFLKECEDVRPASVVAGFAGNVLVNWSSRIATACCLGASVYHAQFDPWQVALYGQVIPLAGCGVVTFAGISYLESRRRSWKNAMRRAAFLTTAIIGPEIITAPVLWGLAYKKLPGHYQDSLKSACSHPLTFCRRKISSLFSGR
jgi:hypothetical protein